MPNSVLWVCLVAIWLFVLVPMVIKGRPELKKRTHATLATRVIDRGSRAMSRATRSVSVGRHPHDADWQPSTREYRAADELINADDDHIDTRTATSVAGKDDAAESVDNETVDLTKAIDVAIDDGVADDTDDTTDTDTDDLVDDIDADSSQDADYLADNQVEHIRPRARRGGFDAEADARRSEKRYRTRQRWVLALVLAAIAGVAIGAIFGGLAWIVTGVTVVALVTYFVSLRRMVRIEERIRRNRTERAAGMRRPINRVEFDDMNDPYVHDVPVHLRRPGGAVVLEIDDEDPIFEHLPSYQRGRAIRDDAEYRSAVGQ